MFKIGTTEDTEDNNKNFKSYKWLQKLMSGFLKN